MDDYRIKKARLKEDYIKRKKESKDIWWILAAFLLFLFLIYLAGFFTHKLFL